MCRVKNAQGCCVSAYCWVTNITDFEAGSSPALQPGVGVLVCWFSVQGPSRLEPRCHLELGVLDLQGLSRLEPRCHPELRVLDQAHGVWQRPVEGLRAPFPVAVGGAALSS